MESVIEFAGDGGLVLGICNGFQVLCEAQLLPGALLGNANRRFTCRQLALEVGNADTAFTRACVGGEELSVPAKHSWGRYYAEPETLRAMERGVEVIAQGALRVGRWFGRPDLLRKVPGPSRFGNWSYEAYDCKLARETKATTILQLAFYSELLGEIQRPTSSPNQTRRAAAAPDEMQGKFSWDETQSAATESLPEFMWVVPPGKAFEAERYRVAEYAAYYRYVKGQLEKVCDDGAAAETYPEPCAHCDVCRWFRECEARRRADDHLSLVAGIRRQQRDQLEVWNAETMAKLAVLPIPLKQKPLHGSREGIEKVREQARVQVEARTQSKLVHEALLPVVEGTGFCK